MSPNKNAVPNLDSQVEADLAAAGMLPADAKALAGLVCQLAPVDEPHLDQSLRPEHRERVAREIHQGELERRAKLVAELVRAYQLIPQFPVAVVLAFARGYRELEPIARLLKERDEWDPEQILRETHRQLANGEARPDVACVAFFLARQLDPSRFIDFQAADRLWPWPGWEPLAEPIESNAWLKQTRDGDIASPLFWGSISRGATIDAAIRLLRNSKAEEALLIGRAMARAIPPWTPSELSQEGELIDLFALFSSAVPDWHIDAESTRVGLRLARLAYEFSPRDAISERWMFEQSKNLKPLRAASRQEALEAAGRELAKLRPMLRRGDSASFTDAPVAALFEDSCIVCFELGSLWDGMKPLLLALRALGAPALDASLDYQGDGDSPHPGEPWNMIPANLVRLFQLHARFGERLLSPEDADLLHFAKTGQHLQEFEMDEYADIDPDEPEIYHPREGREEHRDPALTALRQAFAEFCLDRLKTKKTPKSKLEPGISGPVEADPVWRYAFVRAAQVLRINPGGKGHHILHWCAANDPDPNVREAAANAYNDMRRGDTLGKASPRRAVLHAYWWLARAHRLSLGQNVDDTQALEMLEWMVRRTM